MSDLTRGDRLGERYQLVRPLGSGAHGETWLADEPAAARRVALKIVPRAAADGYARIAATLAEFAQPGIARPLGAPLPLADGRRAFAQEYLPGGDLTQLRARPWREVLPVLRPALDALLAAHAHGLVHGDLKPANLVRDAQGHAALVDFGVAALDPTPGASSGSPHSRSPAQWRGEPPTPADDAYGFGALLHELLTGQPPFYPDATAARVAHEPLPPLRAPHPLPAALVALIERLLAKSPDQRATLAEARAAFDALLRDADADADAHADTGGIRAGDARDEAAPAIVLAPPPRPTAAASWQPAAPAAGSAAAARAGASYGGAGQPAPRSRAAYAIGGALALAALTVLFVLPRWVASHPPQVSIAPAATPAGAAGSARAAAAIGAPGSATAPAGPKPLPSDPAALAELAKAKTEAESARESYRTARAPLEAAHAELWGGTDWARLLAGGDDAQRAYDARDYAQAAAAWSVGRELAARVTAARAPALASALAAGREGLARGDSRAAVAAFERALAIQPGEKQASAGLARARSLDRVYALVDQGKVLEDAGQLAGASEKYRAALALDRDTPPATAGLARIAARTRADAFAQAMAQGQRALAAGNRDAARAAFRRADSIESGTAAVRDALAQLETGDRTANLAALRTRAEAAERAERWSEAVQAYDAALALDPTVVYAQEGRARAAPRAELAQRFTQLLDAPERLESPEGRGYARQLLSAAGSVPGVAPVLRRQAEQLTAAITAAETPVKLALASDNLTEVLVYRVGRLGSFASRELELLPGRYTIVGRRPGFRDVRREIKVAAAGSGDNSVDIRCTDPI